MIEVNSLEAEGFTGEFYKLHFHRLSFLLFPPPDLSLLQSFSKSKQNKLGKINIHFNMTSIIGSAHFFKNINYILLTDHAEMLYLPFLVKLIPEVSIFATNLMYQLGRICLEAFHESLSDFDATS